MSFVPSTTALTNLDSKDIAAIAYSDTGLSAQTLTWHIDGRTFRAWSLDVRWTSGSGATLAINIYASNENVAYASVSQWHSVTAATISAAMTDDGHKNFSYFARWIKVEAVITGGSASALAVDLLKGWD